MESQVLNDIYAAVWILFLMPKRDPSFLGKLWCLVNLSGIVPLHFFHTVNGTAKDNWFTNASDVIALIRDVIAYVIRWPTAVEMLSSGAINVKPMITHYFTLEQTMDAFEMAKSGKGVKVIIDCEKKSN